MNAGTECFLQLVGMLAFAMLGWGMRRYSRALDRNLPFGFRPSFVKDYQSKRGGTFREDVYYYGGTAFAVIALVMAAVVMVDCLAAAV